MKSVILRTTSVTLPPLLVLFALFLLLHGHDEPGGGFVAGLVAGAALAFLALGVDVPTARQSLRARPEALMAAGLLLAALSGTVGLVTGAPFLRGVWIAPGGLAIGTPIVFDVGVFFVVLGATTKLVFDLAERR